MRAEILLCASQFNRRVVQVASSYPCKILLLVKKDPQAQCQIRRELAQSILDAEDRDLHVVPRKIKQLFHKDLREAATTGKLGPWLASSLLEVRRLWKADTRDNERVNKQITLLGDRCPGSTNELVSARVCLKHFIGANALPGTRKWSTLKPAAERLMATCLGAWNDKEDVQTRARWTAPRVEDYPLAEICNDNLTQYDVA